jgi:hypothetical protein
LVAFHRQMWRKAVMFALLTGLILLSALVPSLERVSRADSDGGPAVYTVCALKQMTACELEALFASASPGQMPSGWVPGELLILTDFPMPRVSEVLAHRYWQGKQIEPDGKPAIVMAYPPRTPFFGNIRDEFREVSPGLYLGRIYSTAKCPRFLGFMYLRPAGCCP